MKLWRWIAHPPYRGLPWLLWLYVLTSFLMLQNGGVWDGQLFGADDRVRMIQVMNWINNPHGMIGGWYDRTIIRVNAPEGFTTIWSRLADLPIAAVMLTAQLFAPQRTAALIIAAILPLAEIALLFAAATYFARPLLGKARRRLILPFLLFTSLLNYKYFSMSGFFPGQASHHPYYIILTLLLFGAVGRMAMGSGRRAPAIMLGVSAAVLTATGIESYALIAIAAAMAGGTACAANRPVIARQAAHGFALATVLALILLPIHQPPAKLFVPSFIEPSIMGAILLGCAALFLKSEQFILARLRARPDMALVALAMLAIVIGGALIAAFPPILEGGAAGLSPAERLMALSEHEEARSVLSVSRSTADFIGLIMPCVIAIAAGALTVIRSRGRRRIVAFCYLGFAASTAGMSGVYSRFYHHAMTTACAWLALAWRRTRARLPHSWYIAAFLFIALGPFWMLLWPAWWLGEPNGLGLVFFPAQMQAYPPSPCDSRPIAAWLNTHYPPSTLLLEPYVFSVQFLYETDLRIDFLANYPSQDKFIPNYAFYKGRDAETSRRIAAAHDADLVISCKHPYLYQADLPDNQQLFIGRLQTGRVPPWLIPVDTGFDSNYLLYRVDKNKVWQDDPGR